MKRLFSTSRPSARLLATALLTAFTFGPSGGVAAATLDDAVAVYKQGAFEDAAPILEHLADAGDPTANFWLGSMWHQGRGKPVNYRTAHGLYRTAAYHGNADAQNNLGLLYRDGEGVEQSPVVSYAWFSLAAAQDNPVAKRNLDRLSTRMRPGEILEGQQLAAEYLAWIGTTRDARRSGKSGAPARIARPAATDPGPVVAAARGSATVAVTKTVKSPHPASVNPDHFLVQLGLFQNPSGIKRLESALHRQGIRFVNQPISIRGAQYQRIRVGPFNDLGMARQTAREINTLFNLKSSVIPLPS